jgi:hypothetical protein
MATPPTRVSYNAPSSGNYSGATSPKTTTSFDVVAGDVIIVLCSVENAGNQSVVTPSASGGSVTWTQRVRQPATNNGSTSAAWCWTGAVGATATGITVSLARPTTDTALWWGVSATVYRAHGGVGQVFSGTNGTGANSAPSVAVSCAANSAVLCVINDWNAADGTSRTWRTINGAAETETVYFRDAAHHVAYGGYRADTGAAASITQGLTAPTGQRWVLAGVEILGTTSGTQYAASGTVASTSDAAGTITLRAVAAAAVVAVSVAVGAVTSLLPISGTAVATSATIGAPTALLVTAGAAPATSAASGTVTSLLPVSGAVVATSTASGNAGLQGAAQTYPVDGIVSATSTVVGTATLRAVTSGTVSAASAVTGSVASRLPASGATTATSTATGAAGLLPGGSLVAQGSVNAVSTTAGTIQLRAAASASASCSSAITGAAAARLIVSAATGSSSAITGTVAVRMSAAGVAASTSTTSGTAYVYDPSIPPLPTDGVSLTVSADARGLTLTGETRDLEVST